MRAHICCIAMFLTAKSYGIGLLCWAFAVGFFTEAPFVPLFIYLPELFPTEIRVTAFGISVQLGRFFAAAAAILAGQLIALFGGSYPMAGACVALVYIAGMCASLVLPQTKGEVLAIQEPAEVKPLFAGAVSAS